MVDDSLARLAERRTTERFRTRRLCLLTSTAGPAAARLRDISAAGAFLETNARPSLGEAVLLEHPEAGSIDAIVTRVALDGVAIAFALGEGAVTFALNAISFDMTRSGDAHAHVG